jgi:hypothetical protein
MSKMLGFFMLIFLLMGIVSDQMQGAQGGIVTTSTAALSATATNAIGVANTNGFKTAGRIIVRNEIITYTGKSAAGACPAPIPGTSPCFTGLARGVAGSQVAAYDPATRVYDQVAGYAKLGMQHQTLQVQNEDEQAGQLKLNPLTWKNLIEKVVMADQEFLTGNWKLLMIPWYAFTATFLFGLALAMAGLIRTVFLRG